MKGDLWKSKMCPVGWTKITYWLAGRQIWKSWISHQIMDHGSDQVRISPG